jgi:transposase-like protein
MDIEASPTEIQAETTSSRTSTRTSSGAPRIELITRGEPRRRWSTEQKQAIAARSFEPGVSSTDVARAYGISSGLLSTWRRALLAAQPASVGAVASFARVDIAPPQRVAPPGDARPQPQPSPRTANLVEIALPNGTTVRVDAQIDPRALRRVLAALRG